MSVGTSGPPVDHHGISRRILFGVLTANVVGATLCFLVAMVAIPTGTHAHHIAAFVLFGSLSGGGVPVAVYLTLRTVRVAFGPGRGGSPLGLPWRLAGLGLGAWLVAACAFSVFDAASGGPRIGAQTALWIGLCGVTTSAITFMTAERALRPVFVEVLAGQARGDRRTSGIAARILLSWVLGAAVPLLILAVAFMGPPTQRPGPGAVWLVVAFGLLVGGVLCQAVIAAIAEPLSRITSVLGDVERGDLSGQVDVDDVGELGRLELGVNRMMHGLRERQSLYTALGAYLDPNIARKILAEGLLLQGEEVEVSLMFLDVRDFTSFSERTAPRAIVARLNALWEVVIPIINAHGGHANKFVGDAVLGVFGAPLHLVDHADRAVRAAHDIAIAVDSTFEGGVRIGIGVNSGTVLAGTLGGGGRLEFTVIGDAVNVAARVQDLTKHTGDTILATDTTRAHLKAEAALLDPRGVVDIRGRREPVSLFAVTSPSQPCRALRSGGSLRVDADRKGGDRRT